MINLDVTEIRKLTKEFTPLVNFDSSFTFFYDETNNIRKFYLKESGFNSPFDKNFILGGVAYDTEASYSDIESLFKKLNLQKNIPEVKLKHIAKGELLDCLQSDKLSILLDYILRSDLYIHYSSINILYWSLVDIVDSALYTSEVVKYLNSEYINIIKNDLYKVSKLEINQITELFYYFGYPNIKKEAIFDFIESLNNIFYKYIQMPEFHIGLESLRQILKVAKKNESLPFIMDYEDHTLLKNFSDFYLRPIYLFKNSKHIFDNEFTISDIISNYRITDDATEIKNYSFVDSKNNLFIQTSDIIVGLLGKLTNYTNTTTREKIKDDFKKLSDYQHKNINLIMMLIDKSHDKNMGLLHTVDSYDERSKIELIREVIA